MAEVDCCIINQFSGGYYTTPASGPSNQWGRKRGNRTRSTWLPSEYRGEYSLSPAERESASLTIGSLTAAGRISIYDDRAGKAGYYYEISLLIGGEMPVALRRGSRIRAHYPGSGPNPVAIWVNPRNFNNSGMIFSQVFTPPTNANTTQFSYQVTMDKSWLALRQAQCKLFSEAALNHLNPAYTITRKTYALGGQTIATRISDIFLLY